MVKFRVFNNSPLEITTVESVEDIFKFFKLDYKEYAELVGEYVLSIKNMLLFLEDKGIDAWIFEL